VGSKESEKSYEVTIQDQNDAQIRSVVLQVFRNWSSRNPDANDPLYLADDRTVLFDVTPMKDVGWDHQKRRLHGVFREFEKFDMEPTGDLEIHHLGDVGWATMTWKSKILLKNGSMMSREGRGTFVLKGAFEMACGPRPHFRSLTTMT